MTELEHKRLIAKNTVALYVRMLVRLAVTLYTSRIVLDVLGVNDFALYGIVGGIVTLFTFLQTALNASTQRFMSVELGRGNLPRLKRVFDVSMTLYLVVALIIVVVAETAGLWFLNTQLVIPPERMNAANWVFQFTILVTCVNIIQTPYNASIIAHEKMSFYAWISIADVVLKLGVVFLLIVSPVDKLTSYAGLLLAVSLVIFFITRGYALRKFNVCRFRLTWDKPLLKEMAGFSGWTLCDSGAQLAVTQGRVFLLNLFTPLVTNAAMSIATQVSTAVYNFVIYFQSSFNPQITKASASDNQHYLQDLVNQTSKFSYFMIFALTLPILLNMEFILDIWLKEVPQYTIVFCSITLLYYLVESLSGPLWITTWAAGKIRRYQITVSLIRITTLPATWLLLKYGMEPWTVLVVWVLVNGFCYLYRLVYVNRHSGIPLDKYMREVFMPVVLISALSAPLPLLVHRWLEGWLDLIFTTLVSLLATGVLIWLIGLKPTEKKHIKQAIKNRLP
ncbi:MAG: lipopolysaccharide biosynthesis protein [Bacteroidales bacterium]|nr:lipopolysaccharide biosynthesis protein [Bacteroidales bacterium]MDD2264459.1 lipopolysaccharide biosynthesis protein [Bacteroidales bacterium]MDD2831694.1 lipopolysaccharide biosynthesis protein [Bacteroidales bacterium]MDD4473608.1 lipopolysaccharide biosynthesis protein [Bacteroidales bacterium]MDD5517112.1 lipopolysaccharide biosynthesis protein [Bacteroidales bacterium]